MSDQGAPKKLSTHTHTSIIIGNGGSDDLDIVKCLSIIIEFFILVIDFVDSISARFDICIIMLMSLIFLNIMQIRSVEP